MTHWSDAQDHSGAVARAMLGATTPFTAVPWAWTTQYGATLQFCDTPADADTLTVDGDLALMDFRARATRDGRLVGAVCANRPTEFRRLKAEL